MARFEAWEGLPPLAPPSQRVGRRKVGGDASSRWLELPCLVVEMLCTASPALNQAAAVKRAVLAGGGRAVTQTPAAPTTCCCWPSALGIQTNPAPHDAQNWLAGSSAVGCACSAPCLAAARSVRGGARFKMLGVALRRLQRGGRSLDYINIYNACQERLRGGAGAGPIGRAAPQAPAVALTGQDHHWDPGKCCSRRHAPLAPGFPACPRQLTCGPPARLQGVAAARLLPADRGCPMKEAPDRKRRGPLLLTALLLAAALVAFRSSVGLLGSGLLSSTTCRDASAGRLTIPASAGGGAACSERPRFRRYVPSVWEWEW